MTGVSAPTPLRTARLTLDPWTEADGRLLGDLARTPAVMRYVGDGTTWSDARIHGVAQQVLAHWAQHGFGWRATVDKETGRGILLQRLKRKMKYSFAPLRAGDCR